MADLDRELTEALPLLEERRASWEALQEQYDRIASEWRTARANLDAEDRALEAFIQEERAREEIRRRLAQLALSGSGGFVRPASGNVVSVYGNRLHPILGYYRLHAGIDYDGQTGRFCDCFAQRHRDFGRMERRLRAHYHSAAQRRLHYSLRPPVFLQCGG